MIPPETLDPIEDARRGFTTLTKLQELVWRSRVVLAGRSVTRLLGYHEAAIYEGRVVTRAIYQLDGYCCRIVAWFDNATGQRID